ncbi:MAG: CBS domain-containing protein [Deltaproteobacteria bacterium]|nr:CBS domain-containing protein [Deltaproteobacteria bacterium]MBW2394660.1 CBS domain-containing protein [Deltaproteobacteria bacterium]
MQAAERQVASVMAKDFVSVKAKDQLDFVDDVMNLGRIRHMPVLDGERLIGVVSQRDLLASSLSRALDFEAGQRRNFMRSVVVEEVMTPQPITVGPTASLREAARLMLAHRIGCLPVVEENGHVAGLVTETDLLRGAYAEVAPSSIK